MLCVSILRFFFHDTSPTAIYTLSLHDALPIFQGSNVPNPDEAVPSFVSGAMAKAGKGLLETKLGTASDRKSGSAGMPRPNSYAVFCLKKKNNLRTACRVRRVPTAWRQRDGSRG